MPPGPCPEPEAKAISRLHPQARAQQPLLPFTSAREPECQCHQNFGGGFAAFAGHWSLPRQTHQDPVTTKVIPVETQCRLPRLKGSRSPRVAFQPLEDILSIVIVIFLLSLITPETPVQCIGAQTTIFVARPMRVSSCVRDGPWLRGRKVSCPGDFFFLSAPAGLHHNRISLPSPPCPGPSGLSLPPSLLRPVKGPSEVLGGPPLGTPFLFRFVLGSSLGLQGSGIETCIETTEYMQLNEERAPCHGA